MLSRRPYMQIPIKVRSQEAGGNGQSYDTTQYDVSPFTLLFLRLIVHAISGTGPQISIQLQTSDNGLDWANLGAALTLAAPGQTAAVYNGTTTAFGQYVRAEITFIGTSVTVNYSLYLTGKRTVQ
jgi:hypothetical protein